MVKRSGNLYQSLESHENLLKFIGSKTLLKIIAQVNADDLRLGENAIRERISVSPTLETLQQRFWKAVTDKILSNKPFNLKAVASFEGRTTEFWCKTFRSEPLLLLFVMAPLRTFNGLHPLVLGLSWRCVDLLKAPLTDKNGRIRIGEAKIMLNAIEVSMGVRVELPKF